MKTAVFNLAANKWKLDLICLWYFRAPVRRKKTLWNIAAVHSEFKRSAQHLKMLLIQLWHQSCLQTWMVESKTNPLFYSGKGKKVRGWSRLILCGSLKETGFCKLQYAPFKLYLENEPFTLKTADFMRVLTLDWILELNWTYPLM